MCHQPVQLNHTLFTLNVLHVTSVTVEYNKQIDAIELGFLVLLVLLFPPCWSCSILPFIFIYKSKDIPYTTLHYTAECFRTPNSSGNLQEFRAADYSLNDLQKGALIFAHLLLNVKHTFWGINDYILKFCSEIIGFFIEVSEDKSFFF